MRSIMQTRKECYITGSTYNLHKHHIFEGTGRRSQSEKYGCHLSVENPNTKEKILFDSINQLASKSDDIFGIKMARTSIQNYIDTGKLYKGFIISSI